VPFWKSNEATAERCGNCGQKVRRLDEIMVEHQRRFGNARGPALQRGWQQTNEKMQASKYVCDTCSAVFCLACAKTKGTSLGSDETHCPGCGSASASLG
jgi:DNA-directed RNA polymerase subunit RPC12/RpoP